LQKVIRIESAAEADFSVVRDIAYATWPPTYGNILPKEQLEYMLGLFYSDEALASNLNEKGHHFLLAYEDADVMGFASFEHAYQGNPVTHLHKLYLLPQAQGKGIGKLLMAEVEKAARANGSESVTLNVNRFNSARDFYLKNGFEIVREVDIVLDHGYLMEDFIMQKQLL